eukprot:8032464-Pyramimonas_sp.AAC.1
MGWCEYAKRQDLHIVAFRRSGSLQFAPISSVLASRLASRHSFVSSHRRPLTRALSHRPPAHGALL